MLLKGEKYGFNDNSGISIAWILSNFGTSASALSSVGSGCGLVGSKCKKKDIVGLSIPNTCTAILDTGREIPLKLSSNLLYGVTICYSRKADFVLSDVIQIKGQLQRRLFGLETQLRQERTCMLELCSKTEVVQQEFLDDDPLFDINQWSNLRFSLDEVLDDKKTEIRKQDFFQEVNNEDEAHVGRGGILDGKMMTLDEDLVSIDMDLNFDLDDLVSEDGKRHTYGMESEEAGDNSKFELDFSDTGDSTGNRFPKVLEGSLLEEDAELSENRKRPLELGLVLDDQKEEGKVTMGLEQSDVEGSIELNVPPRKKRAICLSHILTKLVVDNKISLSTDMLRSNHCNYNKSMESRASKNITSNTKNVTSVSSWKDIIDLNNQPSFLQDAYQVLFSIDQDKRSLSFERGRAFIGSAVTSSRSSSDMSTEQGRKMMPNLETRRRLSQSDSQSSLLPVFHEEEPLPENYNFWPDDGSQVNEFMAGNLLPSSIGRVNSRYGTADSEEHVDILRLAVNGQGNPTTQKTDTNSSQQSELSNQQFSMGLESLAINEVLLDDQTRKFYDYIKERADFVGKTTRSHPPFYKKLLYEDLIPSNLSEQDNDYSHKFQSVSKRIAATAFLSILNLASKGLIRIKTFEMENKCEVMKGDDIIIYC